MKIWGKENSILKFDFKIWVSISLSKTQFGIASSEMCADFWGGVFNQNPSLSKKSVRIKCSKGISSHTPHFSPHLNDGKVAKHELKLFHHNDINFEKNFNFYQLKLEGSTMFSIASNEPLTSKYIMENQIKFLIKKCWEGT